MKRNKLRVSDKASARKAVDSAIEAQLELEQDGFKLTRIDLIIAPLLAISASVWIFFHIWTAINWDDLAYMNFSQYTTKQVWILNRYGHIYLQKLFFGLAGDAINGCRVFWCFLISSTCVLVYWSTRILAGKKSYIISIIAALLLCMQPIFSKEAGCPLADFTVMFLVALGTFIYLAFLNKRQKNTHLIIMLLGLIFFWAVKSKETGICMAVFFLGLGKDYTGAVNFKRFARDIGWAIIGMLIGCLLLMTLDLIFIGDALFSVRPSSIKGVLNTNLGPPANIRSDRVTLSWFSFLTTRPIFVPFLLYLLIGWKSPVRSFSYREKVIWLAPLALMVFLTFIRRGRYIIPRYFTPALPILCIWAAQFFWFEFSGQPLHVKNKFRIPRVIAASVLVLAAFLIIVIILVPNIPSLVEYYKLNTPIGFPNLRYNRLTGSQLLYALAIIPVAVTGLLIVGVMSKKRGLIALFFSFLCLFSLMLPPLMENISNLNQRLVANKSRWRFLPYIIFGNQIQFDKKTKILILKDIHPRSWMLGRDLQSHCFMFNIYFNQNADCKQPPEGGRFNWTSDQFFEGTRQDILKGNYDYAFITMQDWKGISEKHNVDHLLRDYELKIDKTVYRSRSGPFQLILLKRR